MRVQLDDGIEGQFYQQEALINYEPLPDDEMYGPPVPYYIRLLNKASDYTLRFFKARLGSEINHDELHPNDDFNFDNHFDRITQYSVIGPETYIVPDKFASGDYVGHCHYLANYRYMTDAYAGHPAMVRLKSYSGYTGLAFQLGLIDEMLLELLLGLDDYELLDESWHDQVDVETEEAAMPDAIIDFRANCEALALSYYIGPERDSWREMAMEEEVREALKDIDWADFFWSCVTRTGESFECFEVGIGCSINTERVAKGLTYFDLFPLPKPDPRQRKFRFVAQGQKGGRGAQNHYR